MNVIQDLKFQFKNGDMALKLIFANLFLFLFPEVLTSVLMLFRISFSYYNYVALPSLFSGFLAKPWTLITYNFFHGGFLHLVFNMIALHYVGRLFTTFFTQKQLFSVYLLGGVFGGLLFLLSYAFIPALQHIDTLLVGASASVMALLFATVSYQPFMDIRLGFIGSVKLWHFALVYLVIDLIQLPLENTGGHLAHLGGAFFGYLFIVFLKQGIDLGAGLNRFLDWAATLFSGKKSTPFTKVHRNVQPKEPFKASSRTVTKDKSQQQIDEILDKISKSGYDSLSKEEKEFLFKAGK